jgi:hypothetical protein
MGLRLVTAMSRFLKSRKSLTREIVFPLLLGLTVLFYFEGYSRLSATVQDKLDNGMFGAFCGYMWCAVLFASFSAWLFNGKPQSETTQA